MTMGCGSSAGSAVMVPDAARPGTNYRNRRASHSGGKMTSRRRSFVDSTYEYPDDNIDDFEFVNNRRNSGGQFYQRNGAVSGRHGSEGNANDRRNSLRRTLSEGAIINNNNVNQRNSASDGSQRADFLKRQYSSKTLHTSLTASQIEFFRMLDEKVAQGKGTSSIDDRL